jgi:P-type Ca2+ transporter type 2C
VKGRGLATVLATGPNTQFGKIGTSIIGIEQEETRLQKEMKVLIRSLFLLSVVISVGIVLLFYYTRGNFIQSLLNGLAASMAILPEEFPVVLTVFMALGAWRLSKKNVLTRKPSAIESLGSATVLCSDKTGTITMNKMEVAAWYAGHKMYARSDVKEHLKEITPLIMAAQRASLQNSIDPMEKAIQTASDQWILNKENQEVLIREYPLGHDFFAMTRVLEDGQKEKILVSSKGAPETIFTMCRLDEAETTKLHKAVRAMAEQGYRVLAVAGTHIERKNLLHWPRRI